jgi:hypothetical protein
VSGFSWSRPAVLVATVPLLLLSACGGDEPPARTTAKDQDTNPSCETVGTVEAKPAPSLQSAVDAYREPGQTFTIAERVSGTAEVQLGGNKAGLSDSVVTLVKTEDGWVVTSVRRC